MGLARWLTPESMGVLTGETGTYLYMSPEMIRHELYNSRTDVYSWGVLLVELISQRLPYQDQHLTPLQVCHLCLVRNFLILARNTATTLRAAHCFCKICTSKDQSHNHAGQVDLVLKALSEELVGLWSSTLATC